MRSTRLGILLAAAFVVVVLTISVEASVTTALSAANDARLNRRVAKMVDAVTHETGRYVDTLSTIAAGLGAVPELTAAAFEQITDPAIRMKLAGATSVVYLVAIDDAHVQTEQEKWRRRGAADLVLRPDAASASHIFSIFSQPLKQTAPMATGIDVAMSAPSTIALMRSRDTHEMTLSDPYPLAPDLAGGLPQQSFMLTAPVLGMADSSGSRRLNGWVQMGLRSGDFLAETLDTASGKGVDVTLFTTTADGDRVEVAASRPTIKGHPDLTTSADISLVGRLWWLKIAASSTALTSKRR